MSRLHSKLIRNIPVDDREAYTKQMEKLLDFIEPISLTLKQEMEKTILDKTSDNSFECSNWAYQQAFYNGQIQTLKLVLKILEVKNNINDADQH